MTVGSPPAYGGRARALSLFREVHDGEPDVVVRSPGRVNLIGDHTDYNDGFVLPMAIDRALWIAARRRVDRSVHVVTEGAGVAVIDMDRMVHRRGHWTDYVTGVAWSLEASGHPISGWDGAVASDVPVGAGLSSSAALELGVARVFATYASGRWDAEAMARMAQRAENEWVGMACGIMDQLVISAAIEGAALLIDCRSLERRAVSLPGEVGVLIVDSGMRRSLVDSAYNERRAACERAAAVLGVAALRDADLSMIEAAELDSTTLRRARHVVRENQRVVDFAASVTAGDATAAGGLMLESHASLRDDFEVSIPEVDRLVGLTAATDGCFGARLTGAGFGGCIVALVAAEAADEVEASVVARAPDLGLTDVAAFSSLPTAGVDIVR